MVEQITNGIKISVQTTYNGVVQQHKQQFNAFSYNIAIENETSDTVQLLERFWEISDALNHKEFVEGAGVVGQQPILAPNACHRYTSNCFLFAETGAMSGRFKMINLDTKAYFDVIIPTFQLTTTASMN